MGSGGSSSNITGIAGQAQSVVSSLAGQATDVCGQLPKLFGGDDKVPPQILEKCQQAASVKKMATTSNPLDVCKNLKEVFGSQVPDQIQKRCDQADVLGNMQSSLQQLQGGNVGDLTKLIGGSGGGGAQPPWSKWKEK